MLAGLDPDTLPVDKLCDAAWAAWSDFLGPGDQFAKAWADLTGEAVDMGDADGGESGETPRLPDQHDAHSPTATALQDLPDDVLAAWVPAYARALEGDDDDALDRLDRHWAHTATFASGQDLLVAAFPGARKATATAGTAAVADSPDMSAPLTAKPAAAPVFGMPSGGDL